MLFCCLYHPVVCDYEADVPTIPPDHPFAGLVTQTRDRTAIIAWHRDSFTHDDISDPAVLRGLKRFRVDPVVRRYAHAEFATIRSSGGRLAAYSEDGAFLGFFVGMTEELRRAVSWVIAGQDGLLETTWMFPVVTAQAPQAKRGGAG